LDPLTTAFGIVNKIREQTRKNISSLSIMSSSGQTMDGASTPISMMNEKRAISFDSGINTDPPTSATPVQEIVSTPLKDRIQSVPNLQLEGFTSDQSLATLASKR
jgi:hypothetical protein